VAFSPDGKTLAIGNTVARVQLWQVATRHLIRTAAQTSSASLAFSPDGTIGALDTRDGTIRMWNLTTGQPARRPFAVPGEGTAVMALGPGGKTLAIALGTSTEDPHPAVRLWDTATGKAIGAPLTFPAANGGITALAFSRDGKYLAAGDWAVSPAGSTTYRIQIWNTATMRPTGHPVSMFSQLLADPIRSMAFNQAGTELAVGSGLGAQVWDVTTLKPIGTALLNDDVDSLSSVSFSPDGTILAAASFGNGLIQLWDVATGEPIGAPLTPLGDLRANSTVAFSQNGTWLAVSSAEGATQLWNVAALENPVPYLCSAAGPLSPAEWAQYVPGLPYQNVCD
jgi:WD40 repeat protein